MTSQFVAARSKLEAVVRISALTNSGPEILGPGSKEHKSVFANLAKGLGYKFSDALTKQDMASKIVENLGGHWTAECESIGQTVTLPGLNLILELASEQLRTSDRSKVLVGFRTPREEMEAIGEIVLALIPATLNGMECIDEMVRDGSTKSNMTEWQGFYFEHKCIPALVNALGGGPYKVLNTDFDYKGTFVWDLKVHSETKKSGSANNVAPLNDGAAILNVLEQQGLGFIVLSGIPFYSEAFTDWHKHVHRGDPTSWEKVLKSKLDASRLESFFFESTADFEGAKRNGIVTGFAQGRQTSGQERNPKFNLNVNRARGSNLQIFDHVFN